jgi:putative DNA primase/helicase
MGGMKEYLFRLQEAKHGRNDFDLAEIAEVLGGAVVGKEIHCPSPGRPADDRSMVVRFYSRGYFHIYSVEGSLGAAYAMVRSRLELPDAPRADYTDLVHQLWAEARPIVGTLAECYLRSRAITIIGENLRFHPALKHSGSGLHWPAMVALRHDVNGHEAALHRTFLSRDGLGKAPVDPPRLDLNPTKGTAIRLAPVANELLLGEGIESVLSAMQPTGKPGWAAGSAVALRNLELPPEVKSVIILVDGDDAGECASAAAASRWMIEGRKVRLARAPKGKDFNDLLIEDSK